MRSGVRLGVDVGSVRVGLAACDPDGLIATPVATLTRAADDSDIRQVVQEAAEREAIEVVVGLPLSLDGHEHAAAQAARRWAGEFAKQSPAVPVRLVDERMTTVDAHRAMREAGVSSKRSRAHIDQQAAVLILQVALDSERVSGNPAGVLLGGRKPRRKNNRSVEGLR
ncbi:Holliday junction resolvase RuvX [Rudaeicoccus suwonensis]|uniref:Putative pre-16S rRNA nuclease n=1 Tax=Rudaeicoccus suwonensis TaxID=657409 RepID=A0A561EAA4_9MICO|nr:Holliday junction resolvase RuvX [Rudaeicoccus suwonensis]TWE12517.1 putative Holliday junction resolvase [Rudaeicoccus suwonensis]